MTAWQLGIDIGGTFTDVVAFRPGDGPGVGLAPLAKVRSHSPRPIEDPSGEHLRFAVRFDVDLHGVEKTLDGEIVLLGSSPLIFEGKLTIDRMEFDIGPKPGFWSPMVPKAEIPVSFRVELSGEVDSISDS